MSTTTQAGAGPVSDETTTPGEIFWADARPDLGAATAEPSIREMARSYYAPWFSDERAALLADQYIAALAPPAVVPEEVRRAFALYDSDPGSNAMYWHCQHLAYTFVRTLLSTPSGRTDTPPAGGGMVDGWTLARAFDLGFQWAAGLYVSPQSREDSRAVGRTLLSPDFDGLNISLDDWNSFQSGDAGMCEGKRRIKAALDKIAAAPEPAAGGGREIAELADRIGKSPVGGTTLWYALAACEGEDAADQALKGLAAEVAAPNASRLPLSTPSSPPTTRAEGGR